MRISVRFKDDVGIVSLSGKFVAGSDGPFLRQKVNDLLQAGARKLLFDFSDVPYIDSTGLGFLAGSRESAKEAGARIVLAGVNEHVLRILDGVKLAQFFEMAADEGKALAKLNAAPEARETAKAPKSRKRPAAAAD
ncbi:MAG TPA: STAS domain-containing protein [Terriglobia bacterium]|nr:STAS domain-containing protein [Terriglobia bacterium]